MLKFAKLAGLLALALGMAGCQTLAPPPLTKSEFSFPSEPLPPPLAANVPLTTTNRPDAGVGTVPPLPLSVVTLPDQWVVVPAGPMAPLPLETNCPPPLSGWPSNWGNGWIPLEHWAKFNGLPKPAKITERPCASFEIRTTNGPLTLAVGERTLRFQSAACWLGYPLQMIKGQPCLYWLDAQKTLQPLVRLVPHGCKPNLTVVIDPGHGGKDSGTKSDSNMNYEKTYTLDWALRLRALLATNGCRVLLTRTNDTEISLPGRVAVAEQANADLFISLHFNSGLPSRERTGVETYCLTPSGLPSNLLRDNGDDSRQVFANNAYDDENFLWAFRLHHALLQTTGAADRGLRRARFMGVLRGQKRPAVLIEAGYLSNPQEAKKIASADYRQKLAEAVAKALE